MIDGWKVTMTLGGTGKYPKRMMVYQWAIATMLVVLNTGLLLIIVNLTLR